MDSNNGSENFISNPELTPAEFLLKTQSFEALTRKDKEPDFHKINKLGNIESNKLFPTVVQAIKTRSRADRVYLESSDVDYIYEVGPLDVKCSNMYKKWNMKKLMILKKKDDNLFFENTENQGFYTICDNKGQKLNPLTINLKIKPLLSEVKKLAAQKKLSAAYPSSNPLSTQSPGKIDGKEDVVIALKCQDWPQDIWEKFENRNLNHLHLQEIKRNYILQFNFYYWFACKYKTNCVKHVII